MDFDHENTTDSLTFSQIGFLDRGDFWGIKGKFKSEMWVVLLNGFGGGPLGFERFPPPSI